MLVIPPACVWMFRWQVLSASGPRDQSRSKTTQSV